MSTKTIDVAEAQEHLAELLSQVVQGTEIILTHEGEPLARLVSVSSSRPQRVPGLHPDAITVTPDFDDDLPDDFWMGNTVSATVGA
ncbi:MAG: type II toxin-antitoxin system prevent-host-death family antitoxin [Anaerolineae bacterium]